MLTSPRLQPRALLRRARHAPLAHESGWSFALELSSLTATILSFTLLGRSLGPAGYGSYAALYALIGPLVTLAASGITLALLQHALANRESLEETARSCFSLSLLLGVPLTVVGAALVVLWLDLEALTAVAIGSILLTEFLISPLVQIGAATVQAGDGFVGSAKIRLVVVGCRVAILVGLAVMGALNVTNLGVSMLAVTSVLAIGVLVRVGRQFGFAFMPGRVHLRHLKSNLLFSGGSASFAAQNDGDKAVLAANRFVIDTGLYAAAYRIVQLGMLPVTSVLSATHNRFLENDDLIVGQHLRRSIRFAASAAVYGVVFMIAIVLAAPLLPLVLGDEFQGSVQMTRVLSGLVLLRALSVFPLNGLLGLRRTALRTALTACGAAVSITLYFLLIPRWGWTGAATGTLIGEGSLVVAAWIALFVCQRRDDRDAMLAHPDLIDAAP